MLEDNWTGGWGGG